MSAYRGKATNPERRKHTDVAKRHCGTARIRGCANPERRQREKSHTYKDGAEEKQDFRRSGIAQKREYGHLESARN
jgi:hypothetical protein